MRPEPPSEPDEPPSPGPSGSDVTAAVAILTADRRTGDGARVPVDLDTLSTLLAAVLSAEGVPAGAEASLTLVDADEIAALKAEHLDGDGAPTDVLSFPIDGADPVPIGDVMMVGDVVLCPEVASAQAPEHAGTLVDELALLVTHAGLHLVGWDHADDDERHAMWARERELLDALHGTLPLDPWSEPVP